MGTLNSVSIFTFCLAFSIGSAFNYLSIIKGGPKLSFVAPAAVLIMLAPLLELFFWPGLGINSSIRLFGFVVLLFGLILRFLWNVHWLQSKSVSAHSLVTTGLYRWVRHPMWLGVLLLLIGFYVSTGVASGFVTLATFWIPYMVKQINKEEQDLQSRHGNAFRSYAQSTARLIPKVW